MTKQITAGQVRASLREHFASPAHVLLDEVRNQTGYSRQQDRYADAVVASVWPSRGLWLAGVEIKVARSDWVKELRDPSKSVEIQRFCDHWWLAAAPGIVMDGEVPETWGFLEYDPKSRKKCKLRVVKPAPKLAPDALAMPFICSVLRNVESTQDNREKAIRAECVRELREEYGGDGLATVEAKLDVATVELEHLRRQQKRDDNDRAALARLKQTIGLHWGSDYDARDEADVVRRVALARTMKDLGLSHMAERLRELAAQMDDVDVKESAK